MAWLEIKVKFAANRNSLLLIESRKKGASRAIKNLLTVKTIVPARPGRQSAPPGRNVGPSSRARCVLSPYNKDVVRATGQRIWFGVNLKSERAHRIGRCRADNYSAGPPAVAMDVSLGDGVHRMSG